MGSVCWGKALGELVDVVPYFLSVPVVEKMMFLGRLLQFKTGCCSGLHRIGLSGQTARNWVPVKESFHPP